MNIAIECPDAEDIVRLLKYHIKEARKATPPEFSFALPSDALLSKEITFWTARDAGELLGFGALKDLGDGTCEVKSMRTSPEHLRKGVGGRILDVILNAARAHDFMTVYLETGITDDYLPARLLYKKFGFAVCHPFSDYEVSKHNRFMMLSL